jgi:O-antigen ligase
LTGREERWIAALAELRGWQLVTGFGFRTSGTDFGFPLDNGYLTLIYETGIVATITVLIGYCRAFFLCARRFMQPRLENADAVAIGGLMFLAVFLTNNLVARYLFGIGNPVSLLALFLLVMRSSDFMRLSAAETRP